MNTSLRHEQEQFRLAELYRYKILDSAPDELYENLTRMAAQICDTPISAISFMDEERQWFKSLYGLVIESPNFPRESTFCTHTILQPDILVVEDASKDSRFKNNAIVQGQDGLKFYAGVPLLSSRGMPLGAICVIDRKPRELTPSQVQALKLLAQQAMLLNEQHLQHERSRLKLFQKRNVISHMGSGVMAVDANGTVMFTNRAFVDLFNLNVPPEKLEGHLFSDLIRRFGKSRLADPEKLVSKISDIMFKGVPIEGDQIRHGASRVIERDFTPVYFEGSLVGYLWTYRDITEKKIQEELREVSLRRAEELTQLKSQFLANMSHEIRTPLNGIIGMSNLLMDSCDPKQQELTHNIRECGESLLEIVNDILDYSKIEANKMELIHEPFSIQSCLDQSLYILDHKASQKGITVRYNISESVPKSFIGDAGRVRQILVNLIGNAVKFTHSGSVTISVRTESTVDDKVRMFVDVKDTGVGIPQDRMDRLFRSFSQVDSSTSRQYGGTGLGLAISKNLCEMMGGKISAKSEMGVGTTFSFDIILQRGAGEIVRPAPVSAPLKFSHDGFRILVVDDNSINQKLAVGLLEKMGFTADVAGNGLEALKKVSLQTYDLILMDVQMPEMSGLEATAKIREMPLAVRPTIIALTANAMREDEEKCLAAGMDEYLSKPIRPNLLSEKIQKAMELKASVA